MSIRLINHRACLMAAIWCALLTATLASAHRDEHDHRLTRGERHPVVVERDGRFTTSRDGLDFPLPSEEDAFFFVVFGDRTGGPPEGVEVLAEAVRDVNLLEPDLVMTVGDLIQGYNQTDEWMEQMREYKRIMDGLLMPWFPVAGNHDVYWRGPDKPEGEHDRHYEMHFGPLWYAFEHKESWFIALYSDEGNPETGEKTFNKPAAQRMSDEQFSWLRETLGKASDAEHVFVFLHHPRWLGNNYGDDWNRVHDLLVEAGNVTAVFAGHIHRMRYDGPRDGIEYVALATVGGHQPALAPEAGYLHQYHIVTVREHQIAMASIPVGEVMDVRAITGEVSDDTARLARVRPSVDQAIEVESDGSVRQVIRAEVENPVGRPIEVTITPRSDDSRWFFSPDHNHAVISPGDGYTFSFGVERMEDSLDVAFRPAELALQIDYLGEGLRYSVPETRIDLAMAAELDAPSPPDEEQVLRLDGADDALRVAGDAVEVPDGPLTLECWFNAASFGDRTGLVCKTENSEYGFFVNNGEPAFYIFLGDSYVEARAGEPILEPDRWYHIAGVYDGSATRLYLDGRQIATVERTGERRTNGLPLYVGADVGGRGEAMSHFNGMIDAVRLSTTARYRGERFKPVRRPEADEHTVLLLNIDGRIGPWLYDESSATAHPIIVGDPQLTTAD